jgi:hypothetical protein
LYSASAIALPLFSPVLLDGGWILLPVLSLVIAVGLTPFPLAVAHHLCVLGVGGDLLAVIVRAPLPADKQWRYTRFGRGDISRVEKTADNNGSNATAKRRSPPGLEMT